MSGSGGDRDASSLTADLRSTKEKIEQLLTIFKSSDTDPAVHNHQTRNIPSTVQQLPSNRNEWSPINTQTETDWLRVNEMLRQRGMHPVSFLQPSDILRTQEVVVLDEMAAHSLQTSMFSLLIDCDKKQRIIEEWMQTAHGDRVALKEEQDRNYKLQQEVNELRQQTQTDRMRIEEMENSRLNELRRHGEEVQQMKSSMSAEESRYHQLELKCRRQEIAISQMQEKQQKLIEMEKRRNEKHRELLSRSTSFHKGLSESKCLELIDAYETQLEQMQDELRFLRKEVSLHNQSQVGQAVSSSPSYMPLFVRLKDAEEHCAALEHTKTLLEQENCQLKNDLEKSEEEIRRLGSDLSLLKTRGHEQQAIKRDDIGSLTPSACQKYLQLIGEIVQLIDSPGTPHPIDSQPVPQTTDHKLWCDLTQRHIIVTLQHWVSVLTEKEHAMIAGDDLLAIVTHIQKIFHVPSQAGVIPRMSEVCSRLDEFSNVLQTIKDSLGLKPAVSSAAVVKRIDSLTQSFQQQDGYDVSRVQAQLEQYEEFIPAFQGLVTNLLSILGVSSLDDIIPSVEELIQCQHDVDSDKTSDSN